MANNPTASSRIFRGGLTLVYIIRYVDVLLVVFRHSSYRCHLASAGSHCSRLAVWSKGFVCAWQRQKVLKIGVVEIRRIYFLDAFCHYEEMRRNNRFSHILVYLGGSLCNLLSVLILNTMIANDFLPEHQFFYQFAYFSVYYVFFALLPVQYADHHPSDGQAIVNIIRHGEPCDIID